MEEQGLDCRNLYWDSEDEEGEICASVSEDEEWLEFRSPLQSSDGPQAKRRKMKDVRCEPLSFSSSSAQKLDHSLLSSTHGHTRTIVHIDIDCFYAQVEMVRNPALKDKPVGVKQKYLIVTCNYVARKRGVTKLMNVKEALKRCPDLRIVVGEDLTYYREFSQTVNELVRRFSPRVERLGLDENFIDVTNVVQSRLGGTSVLEKTLEISGYLYGEDKSVIVGSRPQEVIKSCSCGCHERLTMGSFIAAEIRDHIYKETGLTCCAGIGHSKLLAKLIGEVHKPNMQTTIFPEKAEEFLSSLRVRKIPGVGHTTANSLKALGIESVTQLKSCPIQVLESQFTHETAMQLYRLCRGIDDSEVSCSGKPKSISDEDSFNKCATVTDAKKRLELLVINLLPRLSQELGMPRTVRLSIRRWEGVHSYKRESRQCPLPEAFNCADKNHKAKILRESVLELFYKLVNVEKPFHITLFNVCLTNFHDSGKQKNVNIISNFFTKAKESQDFESKSEPAMKDLSDTIGDLKQIFPDGQALSVESNLSVGCHLPRVTKSSASVFCRPKETVSTSNNSSMASVDKMKTCATIRNSQVVGKEVQSVKLPSEIDESVFRELPCDVQKELLAHWSFTKQESIVPINKNQLSNEALGKNKKHGLLKYFKKV